jgi:hypothetical protein
LKTVQIHEHGEVDKLRYEEIEEPKLTSPEEAIVQLNDPSAIGHVWKRPIP